MSEIFIGRQPIFDRTLEVYGYELLFRSGEAMQHADVIDGDQATSQVMLNSFIDIGLNNLVGKHKAFINLTRYFLEDPERIVIPTEQTVLEVLEDIEPDDEIVNTLTILKNKGYCIALDDFLFQENLQPLVDLAEIVKIDIMPLDDAAISEHAISLKQQGKKILAEKVETHEEYEFLKDLGFDYFQGYFFARPVVVSGKSLQSNKMALLRLLSLINKPGVSVSDLSQVISTDISLSHKLLKIINSPMSGLGAKVVSIRHAVVLLGLNKVTNWASLIALASNSDKPGELSILALTRARVCELLAGAAAIDKSDSFFTVGLFSLLEAMMDQPLEGLLKELPLPDELKSSLISNTGIYGEALSCAIAMERNDIEQMVFADLTVEDLSSVYLEALLWSEQQGQLLC